MKLGTIIATSALALGLAATAQAKEFKFGHVGAPGSLFEASADQFAACVAEKSGGTHSVATFGSSQLGKDRELLQKLKLGQVDFSLPSSVMSSVDETFGVFEMPYIIQDRDHIRAVTSQLGDRFQEAANANGYHIVAYFENGFRHITNNTRAIDKPEDLAGIKLRTPKGAWRVKMFTLYGANPTPMAFSEVFTALQTGVIDGQENPYAQIASAKFQEVQEFLSITGHVYTPAYVLTAKRTWDGLSEAEQGILTECGTETQEFVYETAAELETELLQVIKDAGVTVNEADKDAFITASKPIYDEYANTVEGGGALIKAVQDLAPGGS
ncbi:MAG: TRAP transporter substrate-binding protein [Pseudomonadota bacterium]